MASKDHHIIPQVFLKKFTNVNGQLFRLKVRQPFAHARKPFFPAAVGYEKNYYKVDQFYFDLSSDVVDPLYVENTLNQSYEGDFLELWKILENETPTISMDEKIRLSDIIIHLRTRTKYVRNAVFDEAGNKKLQDSFKKNFTDLALEGENYELYKGLLKNSDAMDDLDTLMFAQRTPKDLHNTFLINNSLQPETRHREIMIEKHVNSVWTVLTCENDHQFILSDNPGFLQTEKGYAPMAGPFEFIFPINSRKYLHMKHYGYSIQNTDIQKVLYEKAPTETVTLFNSLVAWNCVDDIYASNSDHLQKVKRVFDEWKSIEEKRHGV